MNVKPLTCPCGAEPIVDGTTPDGAAVYCPVCGMSFQGPNTLVATIAWNKMIDGYRVNIKDLEPTEDNE